VAGYLDVRDALGGSTDAGRCWEIEDGDRTSEGAGAVGCPRESESFLDSWFGIDEETGQRIMHLKDCDVPLDTLQPLPCSPVVPPGDIATTRSSGSILRLSS
jgi:hypothetical protein